MPWAGSWNEFYLATSQVSLVMPDGCAHKEKVVYKACTTPYKISPPPSTVFKYEIKWSHSGTYKLMQSFSFTKSVKFTARIQSSCLKKKNYKLNESIGRILVENNGLQWSTDIGTYSQGGLP